MILQMRAFEMKWQDDFMQKDRLTESLNHEKQAPYNFLFFQN